MNWSKKLDQIHKFEIIKYSNLSP